MGRKRPRLTRYNGKPVDPQQYLPALARADTGSAEPCPAAVRRNGALPKHGLGRLHMRNVCFR